MPEWNIQKIEKFSPSHDISSSDGQYYIKAHEETWDIFKLNVHDVHCKIARILNSEGKTLVTINEELILKCKWVKYTPLFRSQTMIYEDVNAIIIPNSFVKQYGIRKNDYMDLTLIGLVNSEGEIIEEIFSKRKVNGIIAINPSPDRNIPSERIEENLIESIIKEEFFSKLIQEINDAFSYGLYRSTHVLVRTLFENMIFTLLKIKFQGKNDNLFLTKKGLSHDFSRLLENLKNNKHEFILYQKLFDDDFFEFLNNFRDKANSSTHILEVYLDKEKILKDKEKINHYLKILNNITEELRK